MGKHKIEVFTGGCPLCNETLQNVKKAVREEGCGCEIVEQINEGEKLSEKAAEYGIKAVPTIVIDGEIAIVGKASITEIKGRL